MRKIVEFLKQNKKWNIALWVFIALFMFFSLLGINSREESLKVKSIKISIEPKETLSFLDSLKVMNIIKGGDSLKMILGTQRNNLKLDEMESELEKNAFIEKADVSIDLSGKLIIKVMQRNPVLRVYNSQRQGYYVAKNGYKMPLHENFTPRVPVASGNITETLMDSTFAKTKVLQDLLAIADYCQSDEFWRAQIEQLYVDNYLDIILIPKVGNHSIVFGSGDRLVSKFEQLKTFYFKGLNNVGWDKYKTINLKFEGQIVAERKDDAVPVTNNTTTNATNTQP